MKTTTIPKFLALAAATLALVVSNPLAAQAQGDGQTTNKQEGWRVGGKKFAELLNMTETLKKLDDGSLPKGGAMGFNYPAKGKAAEIAVAEIEKTCGTPYLSDTNKTGGRLVMYGRLGYQTDDGKRVKNLWVVYSISSLRRPEEKTK